LPTEREHRAVQLALHLAAIGDKDVVADFQLGVQTDVILCLTFSLKGLGANYIEVVVIATALLSRGALPKWC